MRNRCRVFEIPEGIKYFKAKPRMRLYMSARPNLRHLFAACIPRRHLSLFNRRVLHRRNAPFSARKENRARMGSRAHRGCKSGNGITATADWRKTSSWQRLRSTCSQKSPDFIGELTEASFRETMWHHEPIITDVWNIGPGIGGEAR